ncbi:hypothetical protein CsSME_00047975 [Camellia sinensis var. sinensis]
MESEKEFQELNRNLYPDIEPYSSGFLKVSDIHSIYWEQSGNPNGHPVVFLHGGPGGGTSPSNRKFFDPDFYRIILFDQRGAGKSTPHACLEENTTWDLVEDIEKLRKHLEIPEWQVFGGSWGSTLALAYSQSHPDKVTGIILRGIFLMRKKELDWFYEGGAAAIYPDAWESFRDLIPENERESFIDAYWKRLNSVDLETQVRIVLLVLMHACTPFLGSFGLFDLLLPKTEFGMHSIIIYEDLCIQKDCQICCQGILHITSSNIQQKKGIYKLPKAQALCMDYIVHCCHKLSFTLEFSSRIMVAWRNYRVGYKKVGTLSFIMLTIYTFKLVCDDSCECLPVVSFHILHQYWLIFLLQKALLSEWRTTNPSTCKLYKREVYANYLYRIWRVLCPPCSW